MRARAICVRSSCLLVFFFCRPSLTERNKKNAAFFFSRLIVIPLATLSQAVFVWNEWVRARVRESSVRSRGSRINTTAAYPSHSTRERCRLDLMSVVWLSRKFFNTQKDETCERKYRSVFRPAAKNKKNCAGSGSCRCERRGRSTPRGVRGSQPYFFVRLETRFLIIWLTF